MRAALIGLAVGAFLALAALDIHAGNYRVGIASACLATANALLLS